MLIKNEAQVNCEDWVRMNRKRKVKERRVEWKVEWLRWMGFDFCDMIIRINGLFYIGRVGMDTQRQQRC